MAYQMPYGQTQNYQATQYFPQPQGNVYLINNSLEVSNIPMGAVFLKEASSRIDHFDYFHKIFKQEIEKEEDKHSAETVEKCLWKESHKKYQSWYNCLREEIRELQEKYK